MSLSYGNKIFKSIFLGTLSFIFSVNLLASPKLNLKLESSDACIRLIKKMEGLYLQTYICLGKKKTIGYGHQVISNDPTLIKILGNLLM